MRTNSQPRRSFRTQTLVGALAICAAFSVVAPRSGAQSIEAIPDFNPLAINSSGEIAGVYSTDPTGTFYYSATEQNGAVTTLGTFAPGNSFQNGYATAINSNGDVTGYSTAPIGEGSTPFLYSASTGTLTDLGPSAIAQLHAYFNSVRPVGINDSGTITGQFISTSQPGYSSDTTGFIYSGGTFTALPMGGADSVTPYGINNAGTVVGSSTTDSGGGGWIYTGGNQLTDVGSLGGVYTTAEAINNLGQATGTSQLADNLDSDLYLYSGGVMQDLGAPSLGAYESEGVYAEGDGINDQGEIVGNALFLVDSQGDLADEAMLYNNGQFYSLQSLYSDLLSNGSTPGFVSLITASGINDNGQITGFGQLSDGSYAGYVLNTAGTDFSVPDNGDTLLLVAASLGILALGRRQVLMRT
jgi:probable HAF family extracellular repeat protein